MAHCWKNPCILTIDRVIKESIINFQIHKKSRGCWQWKVQSDDTLLGRTTRLGDPRSRRFTLFPESPQRKSHRNQVQLACTRFDNHRV